MHSQKTFLFYNPVPSTLCIFVKKMSSMRRILATILWAISQSRVHEKTLPNWCMVRVTTDLMPSLIWTDTVRSAKLWISLATCATRHFLQRRTWLGTKNCMIELTMLNQFVMFPVLFARRLSWTHGIWVGTQTKITGSQRLTTLLRTVLGLLYSQQKHCTIG